MTVLFHTRSIKAHSEKDTIGEQAARDSSPVRRCASIRIVLRLRVAFLVAELCQFRF